MMMKTARTMMVGDGGAAAKRPRVEAAEPELETLGLGGPNRLQLEASAMAHSEPKVLHDAVHSSIELHPCLLTVIDTPQFKRLKGLKQLGASHMVYPGATHTRFEHSIGVAHLGTKLLKTIKERQPELMITEMDVLCVGLAGLCHDLGHGPFSHLFDGEFLRGKDWSHEQGSVRVLRYLLEDNAIDLAELFKMSDTDMIFVEELILGNQIPGGVSERRGRDQSKCFLYDIINNERSGLDVDKLDYMLRDAYYTGVEISTGVTIDRLVQIARVLPDENNVLTISFPDKAVHSIFGVFSARVQLHNTVYQHKVVKACEFMICDILREANEYLLFRSPKTGEEMRMSDAIKDMSVFCQLKDSVLDLIEISQDERLFKAKQLLRRLLRRDIYLNCGVVSNPKTVERGLKGAAKRAAEEQILRELVQLAENDNAKLDPDDLIVEINALHHGKGSANPIDGCRFYSKHWNRPLKSELSARSSGGAGVSVLDSPPVSQSSMWSSMTATSARRCRPIDSSRFAQVLVPREMGANQVRVFSKSRDKREAVVNAFRAWTRRRENCSPLCHNSQSPEEEPAAGDDTDLPWSESGNHRNASSCSGGSNSVVRPSAVYAARTATTTLPQAGDPMEFLRSMDRD